jgi:hypothetical protein
MIGALTRRDFIDSLAFVRTANKCLFNLSVESDVSKASGKTLLRLCPLEHRTVTGFSR